MYVEAKYFSGLKRGHSRKINPDTNRVTCNRCGEFDPKMCGQDSSKARDNWQETLGLERFSPLKKAKDEGFLGDETRIMRGAVILPFVRNERARITIPALNLKFGAKREYPQGYTGTLVGRDSHGHNFLIKLEKAWKKSKNEEIKEFWIPGALLARAAGF